MRAAQSSPDENRPPDGHFAPTRWTLVQRAGDRQSPESMSALETLCQTYWPPLFAYVRRRGHDVHAAQDLVQDFFAQLIERNDFSAVAPDRGKFRAFLLAAMNHFLANDWHRAQTQKRGRGKFVLSLDQAMQDGLPGIEPVDTTTPEKEFDRRWAETMVQRVLQRLRREWDQRYQPQIFDELKVFLIGDRGTVPFATAAAKVGLTEPALKSIVHRLRKRLRELFREEVADTVNGASEVDTELRHLLDALRG